MPAFETLLILSLAATLALGALALVWILGRQSQGPAVTALARGDFTGAREAVVLKSLGDGKACASREEQMAAAIAAKHLLALDEAKQRLQLLLAVDPADAEAALELGLVAAYDHDPLTAEQCFTLASRRPDLMEAITLHRAWSNLDCGEHGKARRQFEEIEAALESKLRTDLGEGDPEFSEWFLQAGSLWFANQQTAKAKWAAKAGSHAAPRSLLLRRILPHQLLSEP